MEALKNMSKSKLFMLLAVLLIAAGGILIATGNNKSFVSKDEPKEENKNQEVEQGNQEQEDTKRGNKDELDAETAKDIIAKKKASDLSDEAWDLGDVSVIAKGNNNSYLVTYEKINEDGTTELLQTVISIENGNGVVELPGWFEGERDLNDYEFVYDTEELEDEEESADLPSEEPMDDPTEAEE